MAPTVAIPSSGGKGESCANRAQGVELCSRATNLGVDTRPSPLVLQMGPVARDVCLAVGSDHFFWPDGIMEIPQALHDYFAPPALDSVYREVARFLQLKRAAQTMGAHLVRFDLLRMWGFWPGNVRLDLASARRGPSSDRKIAGFGHPEREFGSSCGGKADETISWPNGKCSSTRCTGGDRFGGKGWGRPR